MKKTFTFFYSPHFIFPVLLPNNDHTEILNSVSSSNNSHFSPARHSVILNEFKTLQSNFKNNRISQVLLSAVSTTTISNEKVKEKQPTFIQPLQVLYLAIFEHGRFLHSALMSHKSTGLIFNPTSSLLNLI